MNSLSSPLCGQWFSVVSYANAKDGTMLISSIADVWVQQAAYMINRPNFVRNMLEILPCFLMRLTGLYEIGDIRGRSRGSVKKLQRNLGQSNSLWHKVKARPAYLSSYL